MNRFKYIFLVIVCIFLCGCSKVNTNMTINNDKSMIISVNYITDESTETKYKELLETKEKEYKNNGYTVEDISRDFDRGIKVSRRYDSIDDTIYDNKDRIIISNFGNKDFDNNKLFTVKKGLFSNTYIATFTFESLLSKYKELGIEDTTKTEATKTSDEIDTTTNTSTTQVTTKTTSIEDTIKEATYTFTLTLPNESISNNATSISDDGLTLTWNLDLINNNDIDFSFKMKNTTNIIIFSIVIGIIILIILFFIVRIVIKKLKKKIVSERKPIYKGYDESIKDEIENNIGKIATAVIEEKPKEEKIEEVAEIVDFKEEEKEEYHPQTSTYTHSSNKLNDYEINNKDNSLNQSYITNTQITYKRENVFVNQNNRYEEHVQKVNTPVKRPEIDAPDMEEFK